MLKYFISTILLALLPSVFADILPESCAEAVQKYSSSSSRTHKIQLAPINNFTEPFFVYCYLDSSGGEAWTLFQRRESGSINFFRGYNEYRKGFGSLRGEHWLGLEKLHALTHDSAHELWIYMITFDNEIYYAYYDHFVVGNERQFFELKVLGNYLKNDSNAGDSMRGNVGRKFSTYDVFNPDDRKILQELPCCALVHSGAWWYGNCTDSNLNGKYYQEGGNIAEEKGIFWKGNLTGKLLKYVHMAIRKKSFSE